MNKTCGGPSTKNEKCSKCGQEFSCYRGGSWDWQPKMCLDCEGYEMQLKLDEWKKEHPEEYKKLCDVVKDFKF